MLVFNVLTAFPRLIEQFADESLLKKAREKKLIVIKAHDIRGYTTDKHRAIDDKPYGGGPGMVLKIEPIYRCLKKIKSLPKKKDSRIILLSPRGKQFSQKDAKRLSAYKTLIVICGRYEGIDERVGDRLADEVFSIGPYVLSGGELAALVIVEAVSRHIPGVVGKKESVLKDDFPQYTKPEIFNNWRVPKVLLSGNHAKIESWRRSQTKKQN